MIANVVLYLLFLSILPMWKTRRVYDNVIVGGAFVLFSAVFFYFVYGWQNGMENAFLLLWDRSSSGDIKISIASIPQNYNTIFPFFVIAVMTLFNNFFFRYEKKKKAFSSLIVLILSSFIMLIAADDFVQIITFVFVIDILSQMLIQDVHAGRRYGIYNLVADMGLFLVFALMHSKVQNLNMASLAEYSVLGRYQMLIVIIVLLSLFIKFGFFLFHSYLLDLKSARFHRLVLIPYLSTPAVSLILFVKMAGYLNESALFFDIFNIVLGLTLLWGAAGALVIKNLKEKSIYFSMMIMALLAKLAEAKGFVWNLPFSWLIICGFLFNTCIYYLHYYVNRESGVISAGWRRGYDLSAKCIVSAVSLCVTAAFASVLSSFYTEANSTWLWSFGVLFLIAETDMFSGVLGRGVEDERFLFSKLQDYRPLPFLALVAGLSMALIYAAYPIWQPAGGVSLIFLLLLWLRPMKHILKAKYYDNLQQADFFSGFYAAVIARPIKFTGRILTLLVDFVFLEKTLVSPVMSLAGIVVRCFRQINREGMWRYFLFILSAFVILALFFLRSKS